MIASKKPKLSLSPRSKAIKREHGDDEVHKKRIKSANENFLEDSNFIRACEQVSKKFDKDRYNLFYLLKNSKQRNSNNLEKVEEMQPRAEIAFETEFRSNKWYEALEVSFLSITPTQYLSVNVLKNIVEIMLNAHEDLSSEYNIMHLIDKCQQALSLNIRMHPPWLFDLNKCYYSFLTLPMDKRTKTLTNRLEYESESGIFKYCINRLENELSIDSKDGPFFDKKMAIPEHVQDKVKELHWIKSKLEIYEMLKRPDRIDRLMAVMDSMSELLKFDLAIWQSRQVNETRGSNRHQKLLIMRILSPNAPNDAMNAINYTCMQIMKIFVHIVHLNYPEKYIKIMSHWIDILADSLHIIGQPQCYDISDFYHPGKACITFAYKFYNIIHDLPPESVLNILKRITIPRLKYSIGILHARKLLLVTNEEDIVTILIKFMNRRQWNDYPEATTEIKAEEKRMPKSITCNNIMKQLTMICKNHKTSSNNNVYLKFKSDDSEFVIDRNYVMKILYITFQAYLDTYNVHRLQKRLLQLNNEINENEHQDNKDQPNNKNSYKSIIKFINMYRVIYTGLKEYFKIIKILKSNNELPDNFCIFEKIIDLNEL